MALAGSEKSYTGLFFVLSHILMALALYSLWDESVVRRPWKDYQVEFNNLQRQVAVQELDAAEKKFREEGGEKKLKELKFDLEKAEIAKDSDEYKKLIAEIKSKQIDYDDDELSVKFDKSKLDSLYYEYKHAFQKGHEYQTHKKAYEDLDQKIQEGIARLAKKKADIGALQAKVKLYDDKVKDLAKAIEDLQKPIVDARTKIENIDFRPIEIRQIQVEDYGKGGNIYWGRVDRCMTCHVGVDKVGLEDVTAAFKLTVVKDKAAREAILKSDPTKRNWVVTETEKSRLQTLYGTHPRSQELLGKHNIEKFGCTSCHGGDGRGLIIKGKAFGHDDKVHAFHHHAIEPLLLGAQMESNCLSCHQGQIELSGAKNLSKGAELFVQLGCQNCHAVTGYDKLYRVGPELNKVGNKVKTAWLVDWLKNPFEYMPNSRMPNFGLKDDDAAAIASYLLANTKPHQIVAKYSGSGDVAQGEKLFNTVGCTGCHSAQSDAETYASRSRASNLSRLSSKVQSADWVYDWIKNPKNYAAHARMPSLRLSDTEAGDITAYLMSLNADYQPKIAARSLALAKKVDPKNKDQVALGKKLVGERGCYSCHAMNGFEAGERIGPNLTAEALKEAAVEFDFGDSLKENHTFTDVFGRKVAIAHAKENPGELTAVINARAAEKLQNSEAKFDAVTNVKETWQSWIRNKLKYPMEIFAHQRAALKMPNFNLSETELDALIVFLKGLNARQVPLAFDAFSSERHQTIIAGQQIVAEKNCLGCHAIMEFGGEINAKIDKVDNAEFGSMTQHYPPELTHVGMKIRPEWLVDYLKNPAMKYRPAVYVRMPSFGFDDKQLNTLVKFFAAMSGVQQQITNTDYVFDQKLVDAGKTLASNDQGLACFACHLMNGVKPGDDPSVWAPDWQHMRARLQPEFIPLWIQNPAAYQKFAIMPGFLNPPETALPGILDGKADAQLKALREYITSVGVHGEYPVNTTDTQASVSGSTVTQ